MASKPVLNLADYSKQFHLITHANPIGLTGTLFQIEEIDGKFHTRIIAHSSKTLNPTQQRYNPSILEVLAVVSSLPTFQQILNNASSQCHNGQPHHPTGTTIHRQPK